MLSSGWFFPLLAYLAGSLPFSLWISRLVAGIDIRDGGSGHATTTNTIRQVGWFPCCSPGVFSACNCFICYFSSCWPLLANLRPIPGRDGSGNCLWRVFGHRHHWGIDHLGCFNLPGSSLRTCCPGECCNRNKHCAGPLASWLPGGYVLDCFGGGMDFSSPLLPAGLAPRIS